MSRWLLLPVALGLALWLLVSLRRLVSEMRGSRLARAAILSEAQALLTEPRLRLEPSGFPRLAGRFEGHAVDLQVVPDTLTFRKLPALWLLATLTEPQPVAGETRIMIRPTGLEPFSTFADLPAEASLPPGFPETCVLRSTGPGHLPPSAVLAALGRLFDQPATKEVALAPAGLRLVRLAEEAPRAAYLLFRESGLGTSPIPAAMVGEMLASLVALSKELASESPVGEVGAHG